MKTDKNEQQWATAGQAGAKNLLSNFLNGNDIQRIPHAFIFLGPSGVGKHLLAQEFAQKITSQNNSEILEYDFTESNGVEDLRELIALASLTAASRSRKIFILKNFEKATIASNNVMLKILEEPPASSMFLIVANSNRVLPTIMSRCIAIRCFPVSDLNIQSKLPKNLIQIVEQFPGLVDKLENDPEKAEIISELLSKLQSHKLGLINLNQLVELESDDLKLFVKLWIHSLKKDLSQSKNINLAQTLNNIKVAQLASEDLERSYNTKLVLQQFLIQTK